MYKLWLIMKAEWLRLIHHRLARLAVIAITLIPVLYSSVYLYTFWDPYGQLEKLPVALVNEDEGYTLDTGETMTFGKQIADELIDKADFEWHRVNRTQAKQGIEGNTYSFVVTIPANFSKSIVSSKEPHTAKLVFTRNEGKNYVTSQIFARVETQITDRVAEGLTKGYVQKMLSAIEAARKEITKATKAAAEINDGAKRLLASSYQIQNVVNQLTAGSKKLWLGTIQLQGGAVKLSKGATKLNQGVQHANVRVQKVVKLRDEFRANVEQFKQLEQDLLAHQQQLAQLQQELKDRNIEGLPPVLLEPTILEQIKTNKTKLVQIKQSMATLDKFNQLVTGANQLDQGTKQLVQASGQVEQGAEKLYRGQQQLASNMPAFVAGVKRLQNGTDQLANRMQHGLEQQSQPSKTLAQVIANPIKMVDERLHPIDEYGRGFAPYFFPLSLWIGALMTYFLLPLREKRELMLPMHPKLFSWGKLFALYPIGLLQATLTGALVQLWLGLPIKIMWAFYPFLISYAWMAITLIGLLIYWFGSGVGRFGAIFLLVMQLVGTGGTFTIELIPSSIQAIHPILPMTYGVDGLREIIGLGRVDHLLHDWLVIGLIWLVSLLLLGQFRARKLRISDLAEKDLLEAR